MMATVVTRFITTSSSSFFGRNAVKKAEVNNAASASQNTQAGMEEAVEGLNAQDAEGGLAEGSKYVDGGFSEPQEDQEADDSATNEEDDKDVDESHESSPGRRRTTATNRKRKRSEPRDEEESAVDDGESDASSSDEPEWQAEDGEEEQDDVETAEGVRCAFCRKPEDEDPGEDFELVLTCVVCGEIAHRQCAREADAFPYEEDPDNWKCRNCDENEAGADQPWIAQQRRRSSAPKIARDLLPAQRAVKAGSHSVFNTLILDDDPMDGSRSLRKRKVSNEVDSRPVVRKKHRRESSEAIAADNATQIIQVELPSRLAATPPKPSEPPQTTPRSRSGRLRQQRRPEKPPISLVEKNDYRYIVSINLGTTKLAALTDELKRKRRRAQEQARQERKAQAEPEILLPEVSHYPALQSANFITSIFASHGRDGDENKSKPYGGILSEIESDNTRTFPQHLDTKKFESARLKAEEDWRQKVQAAAAEQTRTSQKISGPPTRIKSINFGRYEIDTWHSAPYPEEYSRNRVLYICEFCLKYMNSDFVAWRHKLKCPARHPPGDEIYHDGTFSFFEVDGRKNPVYCQNLCLLAKLFLGSKTLYYDVEPFLFYVMTENNEEGCHFVGYFSKEKRPSSQNNVSCILVLPIHQRRGFGHMLVEFSYLLTRVEGKTGSPEKPLSDMGLVSYRNYWRRVLCSVLLNKKAALSITDISNETGMTADDIVSGLEALRALVRDPVTKSYGLRLDYAYFQQYLDNYETKGYAKINPDALTWVPYVMGRDKSNYENAPHIQTVAQRGDDPTMPLPKMPEEGVQLATNATSEQDFSGSKSGASVADLATPQEDHDKQLHEGDSAPFPSFDPIGSRPTSPSKLSQTGANPFTPVANNRSPVETPIPPSRFEVFPPLPGSTTRKRPPRSSARGTSRRATPLRRRSPAEDPETITRPLALRRGRSKLGETNGAVNEDVDTVHDQLDEGEGPEMSVEGGKRHEEDGADHTWEGTQAEA